LISSIGFRFTVTMRSLKSFAIRIGPEAGDDTLTFEVKKKYLRVYPNFVSGKRTVKKRFGDHRNQGTY